MSLNPQESSPVFFTKNEKIYTGTQVGVSEPHVFVQSSTSPNTTITQQLHRSEVFSQHDMMNMGEDLLAPIPPGEEKFIDQAVQELVADPNSAAELAIRMGAEAISRFFGAERSSRDLGIRSVQELIGTADQVGSNEWSVKELIRGIAELGYGKGCRISFRMARISDDAKLLPLDARAGLASEIADINRQVLDHFYEEYGVQYEKASLSERNTSDYREITTTYPAMEGVISFVEQAYYDRAISHPLPADAKGFNVQVFVGIPAYGIEDGCSPIV